MSWSDVNVSEEKWKEILSKIKLNSYKNLNTGYSYSHKKIKNIKLIYKIDQKILSCALIKYYKIYNLVIINIDGGIEGLVNKSIINSLILFFKKKYKFFLIKIDQQIIKYNELFYNLGFRDLSKRKRFNLSKNFDQINNELDLSNSLSKYWRRNAKRSKRHSFTIKNKVIFDKEIVMLFHQLSEIKKIRNYYDKDVLINIFKNFKDNIFMSIAILNNKICSIRAIIYFDNKCWDLLSATNLEGRKTYASYAVTYEIMKFCIKNNIKNYNLSGVDLINNISVYNFKKGMGSNLIEISNEKVYSNYSFLNNFFRLLIKFKNYLNR